MSKTDMSISTKWDLQSASPPFTLSRRGKVRPFVPQAVFTSSGAFSQENRLSTFAFCACISGPLIGSRTMFSKKNVSFRSIIEKNCGDEQNLCTNGMETKFEPPPMTGQAGRGLPRSILLDSVTLR